MIAAQEEGIQERQQQPQQISAAQLAMALSQAGVTGSQPSTSKTSFTVDLRPSAFDLHRGKLSQKSQHCLDSDQKHRISDYRYSVWRGALAFTGCRFD